jgi:Zn-dependent protease
LQLQEAIPLLLIVIASLSFHEAAHAWTADRLGDPTARMLGRITLNPIAHIDWIGTVLFPIVALTTGAPLLGWAKPVPVNFHNLKAPRRDFALIAAAGPVSNLILAAVGALIWSVLYDPSITALHVFLGILYRTVVTNVFLAVFNMIPVPPLDGGNVLAGFVPESVANLIDQMRPYGFIVLYALLLTGVLSAIVQPVADIIIGALGV